jgi:hypothetical protein
MHQADPAAMGHSHRGYYLVLTWGMKTLRPKQPTPVSFTITDDHGAVLKHFAISHEKQMHLIVVREDLQHFQHLHPTFDGTTGTFHTDITFPTDGPYRLFADFVARETNEHGRQVTVPGEVSVGDATRYRPQPVIAESSAQKTVGVYTIEYQWGKGPRLTSQQDVTYTLKVLKNGQPVTDLEPYLGALGHSVILKAETLDFIHTHAIETAAPGAHTSHGTAAPTNTTGPDVHFMAVFPSPGMYKVFTQLQHDGTVITTDYAVSVN